MNAIKILFGIAYNMIGSSLIYNNPTAYSDWPIQNVTCSHSHLLAFKTQTVTIRDRNDSANFRMLFQVSHPHCAAYNHEDR
jgi:hypothetical protein